MEIKIKSDGRTDGCGTGEILFKCVWIQALVSCFLGTSILRALLLARLPSLVPSYSSGT